MSDDDTPTEPYRTRQLLAHRRCPDCEGNGLVRMMVMAASGMVVVQVVCCCVVARGEAPNDD